MADDLQTDRALQAEIKLYYDLFVPEAALKPAPLLVALHGYGASKRSMMREARRFAPAGFAVAALQGFHQHWRAPVETGAAYKVGFGWLTDFKPADAVATHHAALSNLIAELVGEGTANADKIFLLGFSQSCALNFRFAFSNPDVLRGAVGICGGIPGDWETNEIYQPTDAAVFYLYGTRDEFYPLAKLDENAAKLKSRAADFQSKTYDAAHEITDEMRADVRSWLEDKK